MTWLLDASKYTPHGMCIAWDPDLLTWSLVGDGMTGLAYFWIPCQLLRAAWHLGRGGRLVLTDRPVLWVLFAAFILLCGTTHVLHIITLFQPFYWMQALLTVATGAVSMLTAGLMQWVFRPGVSQHDHAGLQQVNASLGRQYRKLAAGQATQEQVDQVLRELGE